jgi:hypothetical protein
VIIIIIIIITITTTTTTIIIIIIIIITTTRRPGVASAPHRFPVVEFLPNHWLKVGKPSDRPCTSNPTFTFIAA